MKHFVLLFGLIMAQILGLQAQGNIYFHKDGHTQSWELNEVDSLTYLKPTSEVILPKSLTLASGTHGRLTYMVSDGIAEEPIVWNSSDSRIAYFSDEYVYGMCEGHCVLMATYKGVTSRCYVTVTEAKENITTVTECMKKMLYWSSLQTYSVAEIGAYMAQALTTGNSSQTNYPAYRSGWDFLNDNTTRNPWREHTIYILPSYERICNSGVKSYELVATTLYLQSLMHVVDIYGVAPIKGMYKSYQGNLFHVNYRSYNPVYYDMSATYAFMDSTFTALLEKYNDSEWTSDEDLSYDPYYEGDLQKWEALTKALYARLMLRKLPNWENTPSTCNKIIRLVDEALVSWQEARYNYPGGVLEDNCPWGPYAPSYNFWETRSNILATSIPTTFFLHGLLGSIGGRYQTTRGYALDPRAARMMENRYSYNDGMLHLESNIGMDISNSIYDFPDLLTQGKMSNPYTSNTGYIALMTTEELKFIKAEAQYWAGDVTGAYETTVEATKDNMKRYGIDAEVLESVYELSKKDYKDLTDAEKTLYNTYLNLANQYKRFMNIKLPGAAKFTIADLMQQKYVAMYLQPEQWTDMRRYNYSSSENGIKYVLPGKEPVAVYDVHNVHNGVNVLFAKDSANFNMSYSLKRPYNLYESYWCTADDFVNGKDGKLTPNAWVNRLNADTETETKYNKKELDRMGYYTINASGEKILDYRVLKRRLIWAQRNDAVMQLDEDVKGFVWM